MKKNLFVCLALIGISMGQVAKADEKVSPTKAAQIRRSAQDFYLKQAQLSHLKSLGHEDSRTFDCDPEDSSGPSCMSIICQKEYCSGSTGRDVAEACRGSNGRCVQELCKKEYCTGSTAREVAAACRGSSGLCVETLCLKEYCSGSTGRDVAQACVGADGQCVKELCKKEYCSGSTGREVARSCGGH